MSNAHDPINTRCLRYRTKNFTGTLWNPVGMLAIALAERAIRLDDIYQARIYFTWPVPDSHFMREKSAQPLEL